MVIAFQKFKQIQELPDVVDKHREWLKDYAGLHYSIALNGKDLIKWKQEKDKYVYYNSKYSTEINKIEKHPRRLIIEFDDKTEGEKDKEKTKKNIEFVKSILKTHQWGFIESSHNGACNYLWIEFSRGLTTKESQSFLKWITPEGGEIDLNFSNNNFRHPILFAIHWKHSNYREMPVEFYEGNQIDYDSLNLKTTKTKVKTSSIGYKTAFKIFTDKQEQAKKFEEIQPLFYDKSGCWWLWDSDKFKWELVDEVDILNMIGDAKDMDIISSKARTEILNSLKQQGRKLIPKPIKLTWIQFQDKIFDIETGETFPATSDYFVTNPIAYKLNADKIEATPIIDKIFEEWVGASHVKTLYEFIAYCMLPDYPIHRIFCLIGAGMNGKSCFLRLLKKFIGEDNVTATELDTLISSRFEITRLYKKLVCIMGETNFSELSKTSMLKKATGQDIIGFEYKNKTPFTDVNYAKIVIATNNLPETTDKTIGFYRRWMIIDFPNSFSEEKDILNDILEEEYPCLALKCCNILHDLLKARKFTNEGTVEERAKKYEDKSNPLDKFIKEFCNTEDADGYIWKYNFEKKFNQWAKQNRFREFSDVVIGRKMKEKGIEQQSKPANWLNDGKGGLLRSWIGIKWKN